MAEVCFVGGSKPCFSPSFRRVSVQPRRKGAVWVARMGSRAARTDRVESQHLIVVDQFLTSADELRRSYDQKFSDPMRMDGDRFVWDLWHVPDQYTLLRTPAQDFFPPDLYRSLESQLVDYGEKVLGCRSLSPLWLSYYVNGCGQELHADVPHGPWAFVLSLTKWKTKKFDGGETFILKPETLDFWRNFDSQKVVQQQEIVQKIDPEFNRLLLFDPRFPHGVKKIDGTMDPREARLVVHGWFTQATPYFEGDVNPDVAADCLNRVLEPVYGQLAQMPRVSGVMSVRIVIRSGVVSELKLLTNTLIAHPSEPDPQLVVSDIVDFVFSGLQRCQFPRTRGTSQITLPLVFE
eukprot:Plantae.Rhodophyta-Purpureofilum_apyrenoidigerum.ctg1690.p1 GENE.Plantae.Rhodophyta-Purpureofilum_apyrenoidigerum.ctg1690~~Plantae.Rhodophyta-Purpureofilum_apyrenoidigerum.ctg1690.p1  ORF type:complete len:349 (-),score=27.31 Plantae.Rhodophyta-Purpureofilum_apyrenoidigerum.ctg1690:75-1121(-)